MNGGFRRCRPPAGRGRGRLDGRLVDRL